MCHYYYCAIITKARTSILFCVVAVVNASCNFRVLWLSAEVYFLPIEMSRRRKSIFLAEVFHENKVISNVPQVSNYFSKS